MKALLLAAGLGTRLRPLTQNIPKSLIPINGKPLLEYWIKILYSGGVYPLLVNLHHHADKVKNYIDNCPYEKYISTVYEKRLLGTGGSLLKNRKFFGSEPLMLIHADNLSVFDIRKFIEKFQKRPQGCEITMMTFKTPTPNTCGIIEMDGNECVKAFHEKVANPPGKIANGAVYIVTQTIFDYLESLDKEFIDFSTEVIPNFIGRINTFYNNVYHRDIGTPESYEAACREYPKINNYFKKLVGKNIGINNV